MVVQNFNSAPKYLKQDFQLQMFVFWTKIIQHKFNEDYPKWLLSPKSGTKIGWNHPTPSFGLMFPPISDSFALTGLRYVIGKR